ncbi:ABC transporter substrate-binding protein [Tundrisphaera sp. TA3]|uniref:ABC transporter substrate-binding protein n=1 Tax=Tundrisphaera sp. TA3 TaxID=3435775 RepID=UPI003EB70E50
MSTDRFPRRSAGLVVGAILVVAASWAFPRPGLGQKAEPAGKEAELVKRAPFDRITLIDRSVIEVEPLSPRPLPPIDTKKVREKTEVEELEERARKAIRRRNRRPEENAKEDEEPEIIIHLLEGEDRDFRVKRASIKAVEYYEDMLLAEADRLITAEDFSRAFERLLHVRARNPHWPGLGDKVNRLLFEEGSRALEDNDGGARGLRLLGDLRDRKPDYPGLGDKLAASFGQKIARMFEEGDFAEGRRLLRELDRLVPGHDEARRSRARFEDRARALVDEAGRSGPEAKLDLLAEASRIWPDLPGLESTLADAFRANPTLDVAVADVARPVGPWPRSPAGERAGRLLYVPILGGVDDAFSRGENPGQLASRVVSTDLGRGLQISIRNGFVWSDGSRPASAVDVARALADRATPSVPGFNARWADLLERVEAVGDERVEVRLSRPTMKPELWLVGPIGPAHASADGRVTLPGRGRWPVGDGAFALDAAEAEATRYRAVAETSPGRIRRIREARFLDPSAGVAALVQGRVSLLERVPPAQVPDLTREPGIKVGRLATPSVHRIAIDGRTPTLRNRTLRRALSLAIDRRVLLEEVVLRRPADGGNRVADGPALKGSPFDAPDVAPFEYDPLLARLLVAAATKELNGAKLSFTFDYPAIAEARAVCPRLIEAWKLIGVEVTPRERPESELESDLRAGRRFDLAYRAARAGDPFHDLGPMLCPGYDAPPDADALASLASPRILQLLLQLDRAPETTAARGLALQIDRESRDEMPVLPLWQADSHFAWRDRLKGPPAVAEHVYQDIAQWEIEPWIGKDR